MDIDALALDLYDCGAFKGKEHPDAIERPSGERGFLLKHHEKNPEDPLSPFYLDLRSAENLHKPGSLSNKIIAECAQAMANLVDDRGVQFDCIVGLPTAGEAFANGYFPCHPTVTRLRLQKKEVDGKRRIVGPPQGDFKLNHKVLIVDDVISHAETKLEAMEALICAGLDIAGTIVVVDREQGGREQLAAAGCELCALFTISQLLKIYEDNNRISQSTHSEILEYQTGELARPNLATRA